MYHNFCIFSSVEGYLDSLQLLAIIKKDSTNTLFHVSRLYVGSSLGYMFRSHIAINSGHNMSNFLRKHLTDIQSACTSFYYHHQWRSFPFSPHPCQPLLSPEILILAILTWMRWNLRVFMHFPDNLEC